MTPPLPASSGDIDAGVERQQERQLARYEAEQDRLEEQRDEADGFEACGLGICAKPDGHEGPCDF